MQVKSCGTAWHVPWTNGSIRFLIAANQARDPRPDETSTWVKRSAKAMSAGV